jgi:hypothetical protein
MIRKSLTGALIFAAEAILAHCLDRAVGPAVALEDAICGTAASKRPCDLTGHKLIPHQNLPALLTLEVQTAQGPFSFVASRLTLEHFARDLLKGVASGRDKT